ncbi:DUF2953 domain-containing protein [Cohnella suwonensis]|uniref:DUF2953 domain-containing protein n=1 Tax=Cohnella suwonensis TaxID=696072 RepID=A0ABW0LPK2_9BACL
MAFWLLYACAVVVALIVLACVSRIRVRVRYSRSGKLDQLVVVVQALYGIVSRQIVIPTIKLEKSGVVYAEKPQGGIPGIKGKEFPKKRMFGFGKLRRNRKAAKALLRSTVRFKRWVVYALKKIECTRWRLDFRVGTGNAASTAVVVGLLWAASGCATGAASHFLRLKAPPRGEVVPNYASSEFAVVWEADFGIRFGTAIAAVMKLGFRTVRIGRAIRAWRSWLSPPEQV